MVNLLTVAAGLEIVELTEPQRFPFYVHTYLAVCTSYTAELLLPTYMRAYRAQRQARYEKREPVVDQSHARGNHWPKLVTALGRYWFVPPSCAGMRWTSRRVLGA